MSWTSLLHQDQTGWLLNSADPSIHYFTRRDLLDIPEDAPEMDQARQEIGASPAVTMIFEGQEEGGYWFHPDKYRSETKFYGTAWRFILLAELGLDGADPRLRKTAEYLFQRAQDLDSGGFKTHILPHGAKTGMSLIPCFNGMLLWSYIRFGYFEDELTYPTFAAADMLDFLFLLTQEGMLDDRMEDALHLLVRKQDTQGRWHMQGSLIKSRKQRLPIPVDDKSSPSQWITLRAMTVLKRHNRLNGL